MTHSAPQSALQGPYRTAPLPSPSRGQLDAVRASYEAIIDRLIWHGYIMPRGKLKYRDICPECSHKRMKADERCFVVQIIHPGLAWANCHHCRYRERIEA